MTALPVRHGGILNLLVTLCLSHSACHILLVTPWLSLPGCHCLGKVLESLGNRAQRDPGNARRPLQSLSRLWKDVLEVVDTRRKQPEMPGLQKVNEHFGPVFSTAAATQTVFQLPASFRRIGNTP